MLLLEFLVLFPGLLFWVWWFGLSLWLCGLVCSEFVGLFVGLYVVFDFACG